MSPRPLPTAALIALVGCAETEAPDAHGHSDHEHAEEAHGHGEHGPEAAKPVPAPAPAAGAPEPFGLGGWTATLVPTATGLRLQVKDAAGAAVAPSGEVRIVLRPTGGAEQRIVLKPEGEAWAGAAEASGAPGYIAVVAAVVDGNAETARVTWGDVPAAAPAPAPAPAPAEEAHDDGHEHGHGHGH